MNGEFKIVHPYPLKYYDRVKRLLLPYLIILISFLLLELISKGSVDLFTWLLLTTLIFVVLAMRDLRRNRLYLTDIIANKSEVLIGYQEFNQSRSLKTTIEDIHLNLVNTTSRSGFDCELKIEVENLKFVITDRFNWSLKEIKDLFIHCIALKQLELTETDKFNLSKIEEKIRKIEQIN